MKKIMTLFVALALLLSVAVLIGCGNNGVEEIGQPQKAGSEEPGGEEPGRAAPSEKTVLMTGRSVMGGWMEHWGYDWEGPVSKEGYSLEYEELDSDLSTIAGSFEDATAGLPPGSVVFFKFCFVDFEGDNLGQLEGIVDEVIRVAEEKGLKLILGNALPVRSEDGSSDLADEYGEFNEYLKDKAEENPDVLVFDFYGVLAGPDGFLKPEYDTGDSHPNFTAYTELDKTFFPLLDEIFEQIQG